MDHAIEGIDELIERFGLDEDSEHLIIPVTSESGVSERCFLLKRRFIRIVFGEDHHDDYPLAEVVEAIATYPNRPLRETIHYVHREPEEPREESSEEGITESTHEKEDTD